MGEHHGLTLAPHPRAPSITVPSCSCGWVGVGRPTRARAEEEYRDHLRGVQRVTRRTRGHRIDPPAPRPCTPAEQLPDALQ